MVTSQAEVADRWVDHFATCLQGEVMTEKEAREKDEMTRQPPIPRSGVEALNPATEMCHEAINRLARRKGCGPDTMPGEVWQAGGEAAAGILQQLCGRIEEHQQVPWRWRGGRLAPICKRKGRKADPHCNRGILLQDHLGKAFT